MRLRIEKRRINTVINLLKTNKMHRRSRFLVGLAAAAITFASLWFTLGHEHFNRDHGLYHNMKHCCMMKEKENKECCEQSEEQGTKKVIVIREVIKTDTIVKSSR